MSFCCIFFLVRPRLFYYIVMVLSAKSVYSNKVPTHKYKVSTKACDCSAKGIGDTDFGSASLLIKM